MSLLLFGWWIPGWLDNLLNYSSGVSYMVWIVRQAPLLIPAGVVLLIVALRKRIVWSRFSIGLSALVILLPLTGLYHLTLFLPAVARMGWRWLIALGAAAWLISPLPFEVRQWEPLLFGVIIVGYEFRAALPIKKTAYQRVL